MKIRVLLVLLAACAARQAPRPTPTDGSIAGLARDQTSGEPVATAELRLSTRAVHDDLRQGRALPDRSRQTRPLLAVATFAGQPVTINNIDVDAGEATSSTSTSRSAIPNRSSSTTRDRPLGAITRYHDEGSAPLIEGTVTELTTRDARRRRGRHRSVRSDDTLQTITDEQGRFRFDRVEPGTYAVSAYYSIGGRGQIEVRRSDIVVERAEGVIVPLSVETD